MFLRRSAERPEGVLQALGQGGEALAAEHDLGMLPAGVGEREMVEAMGDRLAGDGDGEVGGVSEVGQGALAGTLDLAEDGLLLATMPRLPGADAALQGAAAGAPVGLGMAALDLFQDSDRAQPRGCAEQ